MPAIIFYTLEGEAASSQMEHIRKLHFLYATHFLCKVTYGFLLVPFSSLSWLLPSSVCTLLWRHDICAIARNKERCRVASGNPRTHRMSPFCMFSHPLAASISQPCCKGCTTWWRTFVFQCWLSFGGYENLSSAVWRHFLLVYHDELRLLEEHPGSLLAPWSTPGESDIDAWVVGHYPCTTPCTQCTHWGYKDWIGGKKPFHCTTLEGSLLDHLVRHINGTHGLVVCMNDLRPLDAFSFSICAANSNRWHTVHSAQEHHLLPIHDFSTE